MSNYVQFVVCQLIGNGKKHLFYSPFLSNIEIGDEVLVDMKPRAQRATVLAVCNSSSENVERALRIFAGEGDKPLRRVIGKYKFIKFDYSEEENDE